MISKREAYLFWLKLGFVSFGGPAGQIAMMHQELVERRKWISDKRFLHALNYTMILPGPEAQQLATYTGWLMHGIPGGLIAGGLFVLPSLLILCALSWAYLAFGDQEIVQGILYGIKPAVTAIVAIAAWRVGGRVLSNTFMIGIAIAAFVSIYFLKMPFPLIIAIAGLLGLLVSRFKPEWLKTKGHGSHGNAEEGASYMIADDAPLVGHLRTSIPKLLAICAAGLVLGFSLALCIANVFGKTNALVDMSVFFTKSALVTFGGAYAVLPYVQQASVHQYGWMTNAQMIDGLALGETTPGPLIMVVAFVGFVGATAKDVLGNGNLLMNGMLGASVATFFTFLPSFLFVLVGAPLVERTRHIHLLAAPLAAISAAVVGVIVNLAMLFATHTLWPKGYAATFDWLALGIGVMAFVVLLKKKLTVVPVILLAGVIGICVRYFIK